MEDRPEDDRRHYAARKRLVDGLVRDRVIRDPRIEAAFRDVPREVFVPPAPPTEVYADATIPVTGSEGDWLTTSSQPAMMALMLDQLRPRPGDRLLEIGAGTGYNAAILSRLVEPDGSVCSVEIEPEATEAARAALRRIGCPATVHLGDGADGWPPGAPYDGVLATVAVWSLPPAWIEQARPDGRIVAPITVVGGEYSLALERDGDGPEWVSRSLEPCAFVRFKGRLAHPDTQQTIGEAASPLMLSSEPGQMPPREAVQAWLRDGRGQPLDAFGAGEWDGFLLYTLVRRGPRRVVRSRSTGRGLGWRGAAVGLWDERGLALVTSSGRLERFGAGDVPEEVRLLLADWAALGRPGARRFRFRYVPGALSPGPGRLPRWDHTLLVEGPLA